MTTDNLDVQEVQPAPPTVDQLRAVNEAERATEDAINQHLSDIRDAAILNTLQTAMRHAGVEDWTPEMVARWRAIRGYTDGAVTSALEEAIPSGFGPLVRAAEATRLIRRITAKAVKEPVQF